jgi:hypothetical protein
MALGEELNGFSWGIHEKPLEKTRLRFFQVRIIFALFFKIEDCEPRLKIQRNLTITLNQGRRTTDVGIIMSEFEYSNKSDDLIL